MPDSVPVDGSICLTSAIELREVSKHQGVPPRT
jgi:hypothetical protein